jgi:hypothetical protein
VKLEALGRIYRTQIPSGPSGGAPVTYWHPKSSPPEITELTEITGEGLDEAEQTSDSEITEITEITSANGHHPANGHKTLGRSKPCRVCGSTKWMCECLRQSQARMARNGH